MIYDSIHETMSPRYNNLHRLMESFPRRKFVFVGDTTPGSTLKTYIGLAKEYPDQVQCIIVRDVSATEPANWITPNLKDLRKLKGKYIIFDTPQDLDNTTSLMTRLQSGEHAGCGGVDIDTGAHGYGPISSMVISA
jgi:phosphatidate phosphatase APP1